MKFQSSEALYKIIFNTINDGILLTDLETQKFYISNKTICKMLGYSPKELKNLGVADIHPKKDLPYVMNMFKKQARREIGGTKSLPVKRKDGSIFYADINTSIITLDRKNYLIGIFRDVTDREQMEKDLENASIAAQNVFEDLSTEKSKVEMARAKEEAILMSIGDGLIATDEKGNIMLINKTAEKLLGKKKEEIIGKNFFEDIIIKNEKGAPIPLEKRPMSMALATGTTTTTTTGTAYYYKQKDKTMFPVAITVTPIILDGKAIGTIEIFRDITREKEIDKVKTEFVSLASHQLRTPLSTVSWYTEMLLAGDAGKLNKGQKKYLDEVYHGNQRMVELVNSLLDVSRIELGTFLIDPKPTNVVKIAQSVINEQKLQIEQKKITFSPTFETNIPPIQADPKLLHIVMQNILSNAVKYTPEKGKIGLSLVLDNKKKAVLLKISDTGYGIPKDQQDKIFNKLFRANNVREKDAEGTGLGLYIVKAIMDQSGGSIWFSSKINKGTTFYVTLPLTGMKKKEGIKMLE
ncbi:MAG: PAS domain S-box protein [Patescibacteria group bacterium]|nr:PAS domain S-box protein [Patescibacteria group bacterium]